MTDVTANPILAELCC